METRERVEERDQDAESAPNLGAKLSAAREAQGLSIDDVAAELRIGAHFLAALEEGRFEALGPSVFAKGYLKQYGTKLGLDTKELVADYERIVGHTSFEIAPSRTIRLHDERQITVWAVSGIALVLLAAFLVFWWLRQSGDVLESDTSSPAPADTVSGESPPGAAPEESPAQEPSSRQTAIRSAESNQVAEPESEAARAVPSTAARAGDAGGAAGDAVAPSGPANEVSVSQADVSAPEAVAPAPAERPATDFDGPALEVIFVEDSWAEITDEDGTRLYYALGRAGTRQRFPADRNLKLLFGNAHGVELRLAGRDIPIPGSGQPGEVARFELDTLID